MISNIINTALGVYNKTVVVIYETEQGYFWQIEYVDRSSVSGYNTRIERVDKAEAEHAINLFNNSSPW